MGNSQQSQGGVNPGSTIDFINSGDSVGNSHMEEETNTKGTRKPISHLRCYDNIYMDSGW